MAVTGARIYDKKICVALSVLQVILIVTQDYGYFREEISDCSEHFTNDDYRSSHWYDLVLRLDLELLIHLKKSFYSDETVLLQAREKCLCSKRAVNIFQLFEL